VHRSTLDHDRIQAQLRNAGLDCDPSWLHGALFGLIALHDDRHGAVCECLEQAIEGLSVLDAEVQALYRATWDELDGPGLDFGMLLPPTTSSLAEQAQGVISWTRGYLQGLRCGGIDTVEFPVVSGRHAVQELRAIADRLPSALADDEEALDEVMEHVWVTAVLVRELLVVARERQDV
jgi:uncharacterized protein YgfB (UPF0149 family)